MSVQASPAGDAVRAREREDAGEFVPHPLVRPPMLQTVLSVARPGSVNVVTQREQPVLLDGGPDEMGLDDRVRLLAYYSPRQGDEPTRGLVISLHGWEGSSHSVYNLILAEALTAAGYEMLRLNLRDHGPGLHVDPYCLNRGIFLGTLVREAAYAVQQGALLARGAPVYLMGPSMGGNFVLRLAALQGDYPIANLRRVIAISPAIDPGGASDLADANPTIHFYFRRKWSGSLAAKQVRHADLYDFRGALRLWSLRAMTEWLVRRYTAFADADDYFAHYAVGPTMLEDMEVPTTILSAEDDPVIDASKFAGLKTSSAVQIKLLRHGGHVGFIDLGPFRHCLPELVLAELERE